ncbi:MAG: NTP transferase domain-containing protein [Puniceicoccales bacterium]|jgi:D-glycero-alpha-D-manno-heptose 1-phosphate guanylyltransferase|nr:NTP transferase domain-containing protein [Puniceicoccales bacterium]
MITEAVILAGGLGTRLGALTRETPKPLLPVAGIPFLGHLLNHLATVGIRRAVLATGHLSWKFEQTLGREFAGIPLVYSCEETPLGTGGAIAKAIREHCVSGRILVLNGDTFFPISPQTLEAQMGDEGRNKEEAPATFPKTAENGVGKRQPPIAVLALRRVPDPTRYGSVELRDGRILSFKEKHDLITPTPPSAPGLINAGVYLLARQAFLRTTPDSPAFSLEREWLHPRATEGLLAGVEVDAYFIDIGIPSDYRKAQADLAATPVTQHRPRA